MKPALKDKQRSCPDCSARMRRKGTSEWSCPKCGRQVQDPTPELGDTEIRRIGAWTRERLTRPNSLEPLKKELREAWVKKLERARNATRKVLQGKVKRRALIRALTDGMREIDAELSLLRRHPDRMVAWTEAEDWVLWNLATVLKHRSGRHKGEPDWKRISTVFETASNPHQAQADALRKRYATLCRQNPPRPLDEDLLSMIASPLSSFGLVNDFAWTLLQKKSRQSNA